MNNSIMFGAYFHLPPYFSRVVNEGSNKTLQKCTLIQKAAYRPWAMCSLMRFYMVNGSVYVKTIKYTWEFMSEPLQNVSIN